MSIFAAAMGSCAAVLFLAAGFAVSQTPGPLQTRFDQEADVMRRAKMMPDLSRADFHDIEREVQTGDNTDALKTLHQLVDDAQHCSQALDAKESNPEEHPTGFKQLQIATRESLRRLDDLTVGLTGDEQPPYLAFRQDLDQLNRHLIRELFPHEPQSHEPQSHETEVSPNQPSANQPGQQTQGAKP
jgi:hypothetical protein